MRFRIGHYLVVDTSKEEEACVRGRLTVAVDGKGHVCGIRKGAGGGGFPAKELPGMTEV